MSCVLKTHAMHNKLGTRLFLRWNNNVELKRDAFIWKRDINKFVGAFSKNFQTVASSNYRNWIWVLFVFSHVRDLISLMKLAACISVAIIVLIFTLNYVCESWESRKIAEVMQDLKQSILTCLTAHLWISFEIQPNSVKTYS